MTPAIIVKQKPLFNCSALIGMEPVKYFRLDHGNKIEIAPVDLSGYKIFGENENEIWYKIKSEVLSNN